MSDRTFVAADPDAGEDVVGDGGAAAAGEARAADGGGDHSGEAAVDLADDHGHDPGVVAPVAPTHEVRYDCVCASEVDHHVVVGSCEVGAVGPCVVGA